MANSQLVMQASTASEPGARTSMLVVLAALAPPQTIGVSNTQSVLLAAVTQDAIPASSQLVLQVAYRTGSVENLTHRAWQYSLDGHTFYVITLGEQRTYVYDQTSGQWSQWQTNGLPGWNMELGTTWKNKVIAGDQSNPIIWELDPSSFLDDGFKPQTRKVTGGYPLRQRTFLSNYAFRITASLGQPDVPLTAPATEPTVQLRFSDDAGRSFTDAGTVTIKSIDFTQEISWLSLGTMNAPGRVWEITDTGAVARIDGADAEIEGLD